ncbi:MAG: DUF1552 domain-containing protein [Gammaproteobacteria bacterium]|nr:DUF1552 domain-containing protein [Gammaproteobacteria bacterium]
MPRRVDRRTFLKASGVAVALPWLPSLSVANAAPRPPPTRMVNICATLGLYADSWFPQTAGADYEASDYLALIDRHRSRYTVFSGFAHANQTGRQAHNSEITWLTSAEHPGLDGFQNTISLDQAAANHVGYVTRHPSIVMGTVSPQSQSYTTGGVMVPAEISPATLFGKLFLQGDAATVAREKQRLADGGSILDRLRLDAQALRVHANAGDARKLDAYFEAVRTAERELVEVQAWLDRPKPIVEASPPQDVDDPADLIGRVERMLDLVPLILATDSSRVISLMIQDHGAVPKVDGVNGEHHGLSHHGQDEAKIAQLKLVETEIVKRFGALLDRLDERPDGGPSLLDSTTVLFGSNLGNANSHSAKHLPILVAGGPFAHGRHVVHEGDEDAPLSNLFVTLLRAFGVPTETFGHSTEPLVWA